MSGGRGTRALELGRLLSEPRTRVSQAKSEEWNVLHIKQNMQNVPFVGPKVFQWWRARQTLEEEGLQML